MKEFLCIVAVFTIVISCNHSQRNGSKEQQMKEMPEVKKTLASSNQQKEYFSIESVHIQYKNKAAGQEMIRQWRFDRHANRPYEENYMVTGSKNTSLLKDYAL